MNKKKVAILGSTGSIGKTSLKIFHYNRNNFKIILLSAHSNYLLIKKQIKLIRPKYFVIKNFKVYKKILKNKKKNKN